ncbi:unnamed protein product [Adineta ricciae]|uniref:Uncharacterized protein n=1 Tax=Adineta ricciae TaxID=249248 RepID=A0A816AMX1_ADIRI|nr:unnamed protein product [Adineta ricciae]CAF1597948.1 unnamed protein product [Adineta ricciae]
MLVNSLIINSPTSPSTSLKSYLPTHNSPLKQNSTDDSDDDRALGLHSDEIETNMNVWHDRLAKSLISLHNDTHVIISRFDELSAKNFGSQSERQQIQYELMRIALLLNPSELRTFQEHESISSYADLTQIDEQYSDSKDTRQQKLRLRVEQIVTKLKCGMDKLRVVLFNPFFQNQSLRYAHKYRKRMASCLLDIRECLIAYNRIDQNSDREKHDENELAKHKKTVNLAIEQTVIRNSLIEQRLTAYKHKLHSSKSVTSDEFISSPVTSMQSKLYERLSSNEQNKYNEESSVKPADFPDLNYEANEFFNAEFSAISDIEFEDTK